MPSSTTPRTAATSARPDRLTLGAFAAVALIGGGNATAFLALVPLLTSGLQSLA